jgi:PAS domain S-box-containing protein
MRESLVVIGPDRLIERVNGATRELLQREERELLGRPAESFLAGDPAERPDLEEAFARGFASRTEAVYRAKDGRDVPVSFSASVMADENGQARGLVLVAADITTRKKAEREILEAREAELEASRLKSEFVANMSHEIRTPLNGIIGMTELTLDTELTEEQRGYLEAVASSSDSLLSLVDDILDFSKIEGGKMEMDAVPFLLRDCVAGALQPLEAGARQKGLELGVRMARGIVNEVIGDPARLGQALAHLVDNAVKFTDAGGVRVAVEVDRIGEGEASYHFVVSDTGIGIPPEMRKTIFDAFAQADGSMTRRYGGTGLGLAICKSLVTNMGGRLWVESEVGKGSDFHFVVRLKLRDPEENLNQPVAAGRLPEDTAALAAIDAGAPPTAAPAQHSPRDGAKRLRVLLVEDNTVNRTVATRTLEKRGHFVRAVENGLEAVTAFEIGSFDVVLMDVQMPVMDGLEATALIRRKEERGFSRVPIIAFTAHAMKGDRERCLAAGMDDYLTKPFKAKDLIRAVESGRGELETVEDSGAQILNRDSLLERVEGDHALVVELVKVFFEETPPLLRMIRSAFQEGDAGALGKAAHRLRGTLTTIGAERATAPALRLELSSRNEPPEPDDSALAELERELVRLEPELMKLSVN